MLPILAVDGEARDPQFSSGSSGAMNGRQRSSPSLYSQGLMRPCSMTGCLQFLFLSFLIIFGLLPLCLAERRCYRLYQIYKVILLNPRSLNLHCTLPFF